MYAVCTEHFIITRIHNKPYLIKKRLKMLLTFWQIYAIIYSNCERKFVMGYTKFGEFMRVLRIKHHEVMGDTAKLLGLKLPFISTVETGKRNVPEEWIPLLIKHYNLDIAEQNELKNAIDDSKTQLKINLVKTENYQREMALQFQRSFDDIDEETAKK